MKADIILAGVGGQGVLSIATVLGYAAVEAGLHLKQAEVHGMSQRGGAVLSHFRVSDKEIYSELVPEGKADLILSAEPMESLRYLPYLAPDGWLVANAEPFINIPNYPELDIIMAEIAKVKQHVVFNACDVAKEVGNQRGVNMVIAGAASVFVDLPFDKMEDGIRFIFGRKGEDIVNKNIAALKAGRKYAEEQKK